MLNGVGGCTIAEAKERLTYEEAMQWARYRAKRGSFNIGRRIECSSALVAYMIGNSVGWKVKMEQFMQHETPAEQDEGDDDDALIAWAKMAGANVVEND